jgi:TolB protein
LPMRPFKYKTAATFFVLALAGFYALAARTVRGQDWFTTGINLAAPRIRLAVTEMPSRSGDAQAVKLTNEFNQVLWNDLDNSGIFDMVSKSLFPLKIPSEPPDVVMGDWTAAPASARMLIFGKTEVINSNLVLTCRLYDLTNTTAPSVLARRYVATMNEVSTRDAAHRFANEVIKTLGAGVPGIALTKLAFVSNRTGHDEIWVMDYDGFNQHPITSFGSISLTPRWSPDNTKIAFTTYVLHNPDVFIFSLETNRRIPFPKYRGLNTTPAWSPDGSKIAFCSSMGGDPEIYVSEANGYNLQRLTFSPGVDISPVWNPKTGNEIAFVSDRSGSPQIYTMSSDGTNLRRLITGGGDASSPSWSPNGLFIAFSWRVSDTGTFDIYIIEIATGRIVQLTHDAGRNEHPYWSPDGRHLVFESNRSGTKQVWTMLADGSNPKRLTSQGSNWNPSWSH